MNTISSSNPSDNSRARRGRNGLTAFSLGAAALLTLAACTSEKSVTGAPGPGSASPTRTITIGTTDQVVSLDPAGSWDAGSGAIEAEVYATLLSSKDGTTVVTPDLASSITLTSPKQYTVTLRPGLAFANGDPLTSTDVKFSFDRQLRIADANGPAALLYDLASVAAPTPGTVVFTLKAANDSLFPEVLSTSAGIIVDHKVFPADKIMDDSAIVAAKPWDGAYSITSYAKNSLVTFIANTAYKGQLGTPKTPNIQLKYYTDASNLKLDVQQGAVDVVNRTLSVPDLEDLATKKGIVVHTGTGAGIRFIVFDFKTQPYGSATAQADPAKALAVREAVADSVDREQLAQQVYKNTYQPLYSSVPQGINGATESLKPLYGDKQGGPSRAAAAQVLAAAGVKTPVTLNLEYNTDHYGSSSTDEYALIKNQLETTGLFKVNLQSTLWSQYGTERESDQYPLYQLGWYDDYLDADDYLGSFYSAGGWLHNSYQDPAVQKLITQEETQTDPAARVAEIQEIQDKVAQTLPIIPLLQGSTAIVTRSDISGVPAQLTSAYQFRWADLSKS